MQREDEDRVVELDRRRVAHASPPVSFETFFLAEHDHLYRALFFVTGNADEAEDLAQEAFVKLWERWDSIETIEDPTAYLFRVALNAFRTRIRSAKAAARRLMPASPPRDPFDQVELQEDVRRMLLSLPLRQRAALVLTEILGYGSEQASEILGIRPSTVRVLASQRRATLRAT